MKSASATSMLCCPASIGIVSLIELGPDRKSEIWIFIFPPRMQQSVTSEAWDEWPRRIKRDSSKNEKMKPIYRAARQASKNNEARMHCCTFINRSTLANRDLIGQ